MDPTTVLRLGYGIHLTSEQAAKFANLIDTLAEMVCDHLYGSENVRCADITDLIESTWQAIGA